MTGGVLVLCLQAVLLLGSMLMALMLYRTGLYRRYPIFFAFFIFRILNSIWPMFLEVSSDLYQKVWVLTTPIALGFYVLMVVELYKLVLDKYKGLYTLGRWALYVSLAVSVSISVISLLPRIQPSAAIKNHVLRFGDRARNRHRAGDLYHFNPLLLESFLREVKPECSRARPGVFHLLSKQHICAADAQPVRFAPGGCGEHCTVGHYRGQCGGLADPAASVGRRYAARAGTVRTGGREPASDALGFAQRCPVAGFRAVGTGNPGASHPVLGDLPGGSLGFKFC